jgi:hypothetical protein
VLDRDGINIDKIAIVQRKDKFVAWAIDINAENIIEMPRVIEPNVVNKPAETVAKKVIKSRKSAKDKVVGKDGTTS